MKQVRYEDWHRYEHAEFIGRSALPFLQVQCQLDITRLREAAKRKGISFYFALIWVTTKVLEAREDFRWRMRGRDVVLIESPEPSFTDMMQGTESYKVVHAGRVGDDMAEYARRARRVADAQSYFFPTDEEELRDDYTFFSSLPQLPFTGLMQAMDTNKDNFIPQIAWGQFGHKDGRIEMPYSILCNHRMVDGFHVTRFFQELQAYIDKMR